MNKEVLNEIKTPRVKKVVVEPDVEKPKKVKKPIVKTQESTDEPKPVKVKKERSAEQVEKDKERMKKVREMKKKSKV